MQQLWSLHSTCWFMSLAITVHYWNHQVKSLLCYPNKHNDGRLIVMCCGTEQFACHYSCYCYRPQRSWGKVIFSEACVNNSVHRGGVWLLRGACAWGWLHEGGAWFYSCVVLFRGACMVLFRGVCVVLFGGHVHGFIRGRGHAWFYLGGMHGFIWGACMVLFRGGMRGFFSFFRYNEIQSMSGQYASYWNAFLFLLIFTRCSERTQSVKGIIYFLRVNLFFIKWIVWLKVIY